LELLVFSFSLGGLLFALIATNDIAEHIEYKKRQKQLSVLRLKRQVDEFDDYIERFQEYFLPKEINLYCLNEMRARLDEVAELEPEFHQLEDLTNHVQGRIDEIAPLQALNKPQENVEAADDSVEEAEKEPEPEPTAETTGEESNQESSEIKLKAINTEKDLEHTVSLFRSLAIYLRESLPRSEYNDNLDQIVEQLLIFKYEYISKFYLDKAHINIQLKKYARALTYAKKLHTLLVMSGSNHERLKEMSNEVIELQTEINHLRGDAEKAAEEEAEKILIEKREQDKKNQV